MSKMEIERKHLSMSSGAITHSRGPSWKDNLFSAAFTPSLVCGLLLAGCTSGSPDYNREHNLAHDRFRSFRTPIIDRTVAKSSVVRRSGSSSGVISAGPGGYVVKRGDTLYSIAQNHGVDPTILAEWNNIADPRAIYIGQQLFMAPPQLAEPTLFSIEDTPPSSAHVVKPDAVAPPGTRRPADAAMLKTEPQAVKLPYSDQAIAQMKRQAAPPVMPIKADPVLEKDATNIDPVPPSPQPVPGSDRLEWIWPTLGKVAEQFSENTKGIDIAGRPGQAVTASAAGKVVYSGTGLRGYGKLIIIKHNDTYLSAYAHNSKLLVKEGQSVAKGQKIAEMGDTDSSTVKLHFEIRKNGKPVDPLKHLPGIAG